MTDTRKDIRFQLPAASGPDFEAAKRRAEQELGVAMSNNEFAKRALVQHVRQWEPVMDGRHRGSSPDTPVPREPERGSGKNEPSRPFIDKTIKEQSK